MSGQNRETGPMFDFVTGLWGKTGHDVLAALFPAHFDRARQIYKCISPHIELVAVETGVEAALRALVST